MTVFKTILKIAKRDWITILVYFIVFACFGSLSAEVMPRRKMRPIRMKKWMWL